MSRKTLAEQLADWASNLETVNVEVEKINEAINEAAKRWAEYEAQAGHVYIDDGRAPRKVSSR